MVIEQVVIQHAEEAAFLWTIRHRAVAHPTYSLKGLTALDERVEAHLDGLRVAADKGWEVCRARLEGGEPGEVFPVAVLAFESGDRQRMRDALAVGCVSRENRSALISALGWIAFDRIGPWIQKLLQAQLPVQRAIAVASCAVHRRDPGPALNTAIDDPDPVLRARSLRAVGELKRRDLLNGVREHLTDEDEACRFWAAWTLTIHREPAGLRGLTHWLGRTDEFGRWALRVSLRAMSRDEGRDWIRVMANDPELRRSAVLGAGTLGDPTTVPWLITQMRTPALARVAGEAFSMITGVDLDDADLTGPVPSPVENREAEPAADTPAADTPADEDPVHEDDIRLPVPQPDRVDEWWQRHQDQFQIGTRYLTGLPTGAQAAQRVLASGTQRHRAEAAIELALRGDEALFEVRARGAEQRRLLGITAWP